MITNLSKKITIATLLVMLAIVSLTPFTYALAATPKGVVGDNFYAVAALSRVFAPQVAKGLPIPQTVRNLFGGELDAFINSINSMSMASTPSSTTLSRVPQMAHEIVGW